MRKILGISAFYHDSSAAIIMDGKIVAAAQEERFTRVKHTDVFPVNAIKYCLEEAGLTINELDAVVFYDKPLLKFERLLQTYYAFAPKGLFSFLKAMPIWLKDKLFLKKRLYEGLEAVGQYDRKSLKLLFSEHHLSHAASAFFASPYENSVILTIDGVGEWCTASISVGKEGNIKFLKEMEFPHSVGLLYSAFTYYLGFEVNSGEYKLMGLAPYGQPEADSTRLYIQAIKTEMVDIKDDGSVWLNQKYFDYAVGLKMANNKRWEALFGLKRRFADSEIYQEHCNLAFAVQSVLEDIVIKMAREAKRLTNADNLCMAGGVALNCVANGKLKEENIFDNIFIQPASGDAGGALGAALAINYMYYGESRKFDGVNDQMSGCYLGPDYSEKEIIQMNKKFKVVAKHYDDFNDITAYTAEKLLNGNVIGWFQGRMEFGPRALGNRSILGDASNPTMQRKMNLKIKFRESFRPFGPSVLASDAEDFFELSVSSPYMLLVAPVRENRRLVVSADYKHLQLLDKLNCQRSDIPAVTHVDFSSRVQTVDRNVNPRYWQLLKSFKLLSGYGLLINTSFNVKDEPIVCSPEDAYRCFMRTDMDYMILGDFIYDKNEQPKPCEISCN